MIHQSIKFAVLITVVIFQSACTSRMQSLPGGSVAPLKLDTNNTDLISLIKSTDTLSEDLQAALSTEALGSETELLVGMSIARSDELCADYFSTVSATERGLSAGLSVFSTLTQMGGVIADGTGAKTLWSAYGAAATGVSGNLKEEILKKNEATVLMAAISKHREREWKELRKEIKEGSLKDVSYAMLLPEIKRYHASCNLTNAIAEVQRSVTEPPKD